MSYHYMTDRLVEVIQELRDLYIGTIESHLLCVPALGGIGSTLIFWEGGVALFATWGATLPLQVDCHPLAQKTR
jgi:hypothetical protein